MTVYITICVEHSRIRGTLFSAVEQLVVCWLCRFLGQNGYLAFAVFGVCVCVCVYDLKSIVRGQSWSLPRNSVPIYLYLRDTKTQPTYVFFFAIVFLLFYFFFFWGPLLLTDEVVILCLCHVYEHTISFYCLPPSPTTHDNVSFVDCDCGFYFVSVDS